LKIFRRTEKSLTWFSMLSLGFSGEEKWSKKDNGNWYELEII
jgi:hypothetical protein